jgi:AcrR family transcriptional regulator
MTDEADVRKASPTTAERILSSARDAFYEKGFFAATVEEIAARAGLSRATVYLRYRSKDDMLVDLLQEDLHAQLDVYRQLAALKRLTPGTLRSWLTFFSTEMSNKRSSLNLFAAAGALDLRIEGAVGLHRENIISLLGQRFPGFDLEALGRDARELQKVRCIMMIFLIEGVALNFPDRPSMPTLKLGIDVLAPTLLHFLKRGHIQTA